MHFATHSIHISAHRFATDLSAAAGTLKPVSIEPRASDSQC